MLHPRLKMHTEKELGYEVSILNGATENGNKSIAQLKNESLKAEIEKSKAAKAKLEKALAEKKAKEARENAAAAAQSARHAKMIK